MLLSCTGINKYYQGAQVLRSVALTIENQDRIGLVGINGCGKSTLIKALLNLKSQMSGKINT